MSAVAGQRSEYSPLEIREALTALAYYGGNARRASEQTGIAKSTLHAWRLHKHREMYLEICQREGPRLEQLAADQARELILRSSEVEHRILDRLSTDEDIPTKELSDLAGALQRTTTSKGINTTKLLELTGRPTQVVQHLSPQEAIRGLARDLGVTFESTAEEVTEVPLLAESGQANAREHSAS